MKVLMYETKSTGCGKITGMFECDKFGEIGFWDYSLSTLNIYNVGGKNNFKMGNPCISLPDFKDYKGDKTIWAWDIKQPSKFDKPIELGECYKKDTMTREEYKEKYNGKNWLVYESFLWFQQRITRAPQSWCYAIYNGELVILLSIHHKYADLIYSGLKTVEVRKSYPRKGE